MKIYLRDHIQQIDGDELSHLLGRLPQWRLEQALRFRHHAGRCENAAAFLLLQDALCSDYGMREVPPFAYGEHGKPYLPDYPQLHFNLSHCRNAVLCVLNDAPVGADIESIRTFRPALLDYTMNAREKEEILASPQPERSFTRLWTRKEAVLKLTGEGVGSQMHDILLPQHLEQAGIQLQTVEATDYIYSVATIR